MDSAIPQPVAQAMPIERPFSLRIPERMPEFLLRAIAHFIRRNRDVAEALVALRQFEGEDFWTWAIFLRPLREGFPKAEAQTLILDAARVLLEVVDPDRRDLPLDFMVAEPNVFDLYRKAAVLVTADGVRPGPVSQV